MQPASTTLASHVQHGAEICKRQHRSTADKADGKAPAGFLVAEHIPQAVAGQQEQLVRIVAPQNGHLRGHGHTGERHVPNVFGMAHPKQASSEATATPGSNGVILLPS